MWNIHDPDAFLDRLTRTQFSRPHVFLFGSALTSPFPDGSPGVPGVNGVVALIKAYYRRNYPSALSKLEQILSTAKNQYQAAFEHLSGRGSAADANSIIQQAVLTAYTGPTQQPYSNASCRAAESNISGWHISPWLESIGKLLAAPPQQIADTVLTTNFDPLIQIAIEKAGGRSRTSVLARDGNLAQNAGIGCHVIHLHGHWTATDTLHTQVQLRQERPHLRAFLQRLLEKFAIVVVGYSGWDDIFTKAIADVIESCEGTPELLWAFFETNTDRIVEKNSELLARLRPGYERNHIALYHSINLREQLVALYDRFHPRDQGTAADEHSREQAVSHPGETPTVELISASATSVIPRADVESITTATAVQPLPSTGERAPTQGINPTPRDTYQSESPQHSSTNSSLPAAEQPSILSAAPSLPYLAERRPASGVNNLIESRNEVTAAKSSQNEHISSVIERRVGSAGGRTLTRFQIRQALNFMFPLEIEFDAFLIDHFPSISRSSNRITKTNLLLEITNEKVISDLFYELYSENLRKIQGQISESRFKSEKSITISRLRNDLEVLLRDREAFSKRNLSIVNIDKEILAIRREIRRGPQLAERDILGERYSLMELIGKGAAAHVWQAIDTKAESSVVALKVLLSNHAEDRTMIERFSRGARRMQELSHPNIVQIIEPVSEDDGWFYFVMPYFGGGSLHDAILHNRISTEDGLTIVAQISEALEYAHSKNYIHRDVKPQNIILNDNNEGFLCDFDLMISDKDTMLTQHGNPRGTYGFAAPEQLQGSDSIDHHADIYGLAMTTIFVIAKKSINTHFLVDTKKNIYDLDLGEDLTRLLLSAIEYDVAKRPSSALRFGRMVLDFYHIHIQFRLNQSRRLLLNFLCQREQYQRDISNKREELVSVLRIRSTQLQGDEGRQNLIFSIHDVSDELIDSKLESKIIVRGQREKRFNSGELIVGDLVEHALFGIGQIIGIYDNVFTVLFAKYGIKKLIARYLKRLSS
jgi:serine/threonine protein kinase